MSGFVKRPIRLQPVSLAERLRQTAKNGLAVKVERPITGHGGHLKSQGYILHLHRQNGHYIAWCTALDKKAKEA